MSKQTPPEVKKVFNPRGAMIALVVIAGIGAAIFLLPILWICLLIVAGGAELG